MALQIDVLKKYVEIFKQLDSEFERHFNKYDTVSQLHRLMEQDGQEVLQEFLNLVECNLRVDYNVKQSFRSYSHVPARLHSFQWNQRYIQIFRVEKGDFFKKYVEMSFEVPLYSRSLATEDGLVYLIGGYIKQQNKYLKSCLKYDEIFEKLEEKAQMIHQHADHSLATLNGFIYVVGSFVNNQVSGDCERYDVTQNKWSLIASLNVPRSGVALCSFGNQYLFAFGGRVSQKQYVDVIEAYDSKRNTWRVFDGVDKKQWVPGYMSAAYQITSNEIIIFGGKSALMQQIFDGCFVFDLEKMEVKERGSLVNPCSFMNTPLVFNNNIYCYGNDVYVHCYSIPEQRWTGILKTL